LAALPFSTHKGVYMTTIQRSDLKSSYSWAAISPDDPRITGKPDSTLLNRGEGYEVLAFLNRHFNNKNDALKAERLIQKELPSNIRSHANVLTWLQTNWNTIT
jgi:hypothetical protein